jgi:hypothetical protein
MKTSEQKIIELYDRDAIHDLPVRYCDCVWQGRLEAMLDLFTKDGVFVTKGRENESTCRGRDELRAMYQKALGDFTPRPYIHNHVVDLQGASRATGRCYVELRSASRNMEWIGTGFYDDEYVKEGDAWKFASRKFTSFGMRTAQDESKSSKS